ncbi:hypothetical protein GGF50DRAFT_54504 [Schizophyllum commune]
MSVSQDLEEERPETPLALDTALSSSAEAATTLQSPSTASTSSSSSHQFVLPIPTPSTNRSRASFSLPDQNDEAAVWSLDSLPPEIKKADVSIAPDGSFVETPSGAAAHQLKRIYDQRLGVGKDFRSPFAITGFVNQHGRWMYRVGYRDMSAPAASAAEVEASQARSSAVPEVRPREPPTGGRTKRRSRMSVHTLLNPSMFSKGNAAAAATRPMPNATPKKLRKTRSIPDMVSTTASGSRPPSGRGHSHSVTAADMLRLPSTESNASQKQRDMFADVMNLSGPSPGQSTHSLVHSDRSSSSSLLIPSIIPAPFGQGVAFDAPSPKPSAPFLPPPRFLREMQSFESVMTARQDDVRSDLEYDGERPPSAVRLRPPTIHEAETEAETAEPAPEKEAAQVAEEPALFSRYTTEVFDVLQTYRGLPQLDKLSAAEQEDSTVTVKLSLSSDDTAAPRDDPRFVIWGDVTLDPTGDDVSVSGSWTDQSAPSSGAISRKQSTRSGRQSIKGKHAEVPQLRVCRDGSSHPHKVMLAATIERWIAQLTSDLDYDELLVFFLTYRTYVSAVDLCHLLICRFHWALQQGETPQDEKTRRIVRVRTFVAIRYWLLTFFNVDFLPDRELRALVSSWLNTLVRDPALTKHTDGLNIVRKLRKVAKDCQHMHSRRTGDVRNRPRASTKSTSPPRHIFGEKFAEATRRSDAEDEDSDVELDFLDSDGGASGSATPSGSLAAPLPATIPLTSLNILARTDHAPGPGEDSLPIVQTARTLPVHHNALSRVFVKTIGRIGRWKRVLNSRALPPAPMNDSGNVSAFDLEWNVSRDMLTVQGGVGAYLKMIGQPEDQGEAAPKQSLATVRPSDVSEASTTVRTRASAERIVSTASTSTAVGSPLDPANDRDADAVTLNTEASRPSTDESAALAPSTASTSSSSPRPNRASSIRTSSTDSFGAPLPQGNFTAAFRAPGGAPYHFDVASIDDLDLSDESSDEGGPTAPPGLGGQHKPARKLPLRRDFEFVQRPESASSMGVISRGSFASGSEFSEGSANRSSAASSSSIGGPVTKWQLEALKKSLAEQEEEGDVEAALRQLEGQINPNKVQEKRAKVEGWMRDIKYRLKTGDYDEDDASFVDEDLEEDGEGEEDDEREEVHSRLSVDSSGHEREDTATQEMSTTPMPDQTLHRRAEIGSPPRSGDAKPAPEDAVPMEILESRMPSQSPDLPKIGMSLPRASDPDLPRFHKTFVMNYKAEQLVQHFSMIDRELFISVKFDELISGDWLFCEEVNVLDWAQYLKDRARWKAEQRCADKTSALAAVRARFNLLANFVVSEIVLTPPSERPMVVDKFIRIAWKAYQLSSFNTLMAILTGLRSEWVAKAMRRLWHRLGMFETRMLNDFKQYTTSEGDFKYIRHAVEAIADSKPLDAGSHAPSVVSGGTGDTPGKGKNGGDRAVPTACIPFIGIYLAPLKRFSQLPDLIDPTAPHEIVGVDPVTNNYDPPAHPEVFAALKPLPPSINLEPLINVQKQRSIAGVVRSLVTGQHLASRVHYPIDKRVFQKCLRLRGLDTDMLQRALAMY